MVTNFFKRNTNNNNNNNNNNNSIQNIIQDNENIPDKHEKSGVYQMKCLDSPLTYIGQTEYFILNINTYRQIGLIVTSDIQITY
jgi:hypothetical protein